MKRKIALLLLLLAITIPQATGYSQCNADANIYHFTYEGKSYEVLKEKLNWADAAACAVSRGGYLAEINNEAEQQAVFNGVTAAGIDTEQTEAADGFGSYVWLGGNDITTEGWWVLNGDNNDQAIFFWQGNANGSALNGRYNNWGNEPDNWGEGTGQDALAMAVAAFPNGEAGEWNDVSHANELFFVVEHNSLLKGGINNEPQINVAIYPNPSNGLITINASGNVQQAELYNFAGSRIKTFDVATLTSGTIDITALPAGIYWISLLFDDEIAVSRKIVRK